MFSRLDFIAPLRFDFVVQIFFPLNYCRTLLLQQKQDSVTVLAEGGGDGTAVLGSVWDSVSERKSLTELIKGVNCASALIVLFN